MLVVALSLSEQVEKVGAYAGLAAFFGFAILAILCFAQARELKRLRDWAGRAPERAAELEARVMADAAARARQPVRPATPAAAATPAPSPSPAPAAAAAGNGAPAETAAAPAADGAATPAPGATDGAAAAETPAPASEETPAAAEGEEKKAETEAAPDDTAKEHAVPAAAAAAPAAAPAATPAAAPASPPGNGTGSGEVPPLPRATPAPRPGPAAPPPRPRPGAAPLRAGGGASRPAGPAPGRPVPAGRRPAAPAPAPQEGRSTGRLAALVAGGVIGLVVLGFAATQIFGGGEEEPTPPNRPANNTTAEPTAEATSEPAGGGLSKADTTVAVLNGTTITGLAKQTSDRIAEAGFEAGATADYTDQARSASLVFYGDGARRRAIEVARLLDIPSSEVREMDQSARALAGEAAEVVVVVGADQAP